MAGLALLPLADGVRRATEALAGKFGSAVGGLLNMTFGNMTELMLSFFVLWSGQAEVVKASIIGSILCNSLLALGAATVVGGWKRERQTFRRERAGLLGSLLMLSVTALLIPALFDYTERGLLGAHDPGPREERLSLWASGILLLVYIANLVYTFVTHRDVFARKPDPPDEGSAEGQGVPPTQEKSSDRGSRLKSDGDGAFESQKAEDDEEGEGAWSIWKSVTVLVGATIALGAEAYLVSGALEPAAKALGLTPLFIGLIVLPIFGNAAEMLASLYFARKDQMGLVFSVTVGSSIQVALLTTPLLVLISYLLKHPINLVFVNPLELIAVVAVAFTVRSVAQDGETTWFEGVLLMGVYALLALAFFFATPVHNP